MTADRLTRSSRTIVFVVVAVLAGSSMLALVGGAEARAAECYTVRFNLVGSPSGPATVTGLMTGDLQGTVHLMFDPASVEFAGATVSNSGTAHGIVPGGAVPALASSTRGSTTAICLLTGPGRQPRSSKTSGGIGRPELSMWRT